MKTNKPAVLGKALLIAMMCVAAAACSKKVKDAPPEPPAQPVTDTAPAPSGVYGPEDLDRDACLRQRTVYFDLDRDNVRSEFQAQMACHAKYLRDRPSSRITLEGHADERGSREYNVALGQRRSESVKRLLILLGADEKQIEAVSLGEEKPSCTESTESCWAQNRRADVRYGTEF